jgi:hypothetical protein
MWTFLGIQTLLAQRPVLLTESAITTPKYSADFFLGSEYLRKQQTATLNSPLILGRAGVIGWHQGVAENVNLDIDWRGYLFATLRNGSKVNDWGDVTIATRIQFIQERLFSPAFGLRTAVKLPNTKYIPYGLGSNQTDFFVHLLLTKHFGALETRLNAGLGIVGNPKDPSAQDDLYMVSGALLVPAASWLTLFVEAHGFMGYLDDDDKLVARSGCALLLPDFEVNLFGSYGVLGSHVDVAGAFESSERWSAGIALKKTFDFGSVKPSEKK